MGRYTLKRILLLIPVVLGVSFLIFTIMYFVPGDPARIILGGSATQAELAEKRAQLGLNQPYIVQLVQFLKDTFLNFNLGTSYLTNTSVLGEIAVRFPRTLSLAFICIIIQVAIGIPLGMVAATHQNGVVDKICMVLAMIGVSLPEFWVALMLVIVFSLKLGWLPAYGFGGISYYILPCIALSLRGIATLARLTRSNMVEVLHADYVTTARAKGIPKQRILLSHALPNGIIPVIQSLGSSFGASLGGAIVIENVFSIAGMGTYLIGGVNNLDYPVVRSSVIVLALAFSIVMLIVDLAFAFIDPRIKAQYAGRKKRQVRKNA